MLVDFLNNKISFQDALKTLPQEEFMESEEDEEAKEVDLLLSPITDGSGSGAQR